MEIDLSSLERNLRRISAALPSSIRYIAVVKADAYGHGLAPIVTRLMRGGADLFAVANVNEAAQIRELSSGWPLLVLSPLLPGEESLIFDSDVIPTLSSHDEASRLASVAKRLGKPLPVHLKIDTGMGRAGIWHGSALALYQELVKMPHLKLAGVFTHFSSAETDPEFTQHQRELFLETLESLPGLDPNELLIHADNSAALDSLSPNGPFNAVRVGLLQFGIRPYSKSLFGTIKVEPVFSLHARVGLIKDLPAGTGIGYGRTNIIAQETRIAIITAGYGDGIPTSVSNRGFALIRGRRCPVLGRVSMDQTAVDVSGLPLVSVADTATLIGRQGDDSIEITEFSSWANQIPWEILCSVTKRVPRIYTTDSAS